MPTRRFLLAALSILPAAWLARRAGRTAPVELVMVDGWVLRRDDLA